VGERAQRTVEKKAAGRISTGGRLTPMRQAAWVRRSGGETQLHARRQRGAEMHAWSPSHRRTRPCEAITTYGVRSPRNGVEPVSMSIWMLVRRLLKP